MIRQTNIPVTGRHERILLLHGSPIMHYRVLVYNYFRKRFEDDGIDFRVAGPAIQSEIPTPVQFPFRKTKTSLAGWGQVIRSEHPDAVILFSGLRNPYCHYRKTKT